MRQPLAPHKLFPATFAVAIIVAALALALSGCLAPSPMPQPDDNISDKLYTESASDVELDLVIYDNDPILITTGESIELPNYPDMKEGGFYRVVADVDYLTGGVAGYDHHPDVRKVGSIEEASPDSLAIPTVEEGGAALLAIGGYAEGDYLLSEPGRAAVLLNGEWAYTYDESLKRDDGTWLLYRPGADMALVEEGIANGVFCSADYFVYPATSAT